MFPGYRADPAHALIAAGLDRVVRGEAHRLLIVAPPQHGKSELVSVRLPAFWLGHRPEDPVIIASYASALAHSKSRMARSVVEDGRYRQVFPGIITDQSSRAVENWGLAGHRGGVLASGVGGALTGYGAGLGVVDDPFENWEQAQSPAYRDLVWDWYRSVFRTRLWEGGAIVLVMTRWHEDDLAGRILEDRAEPWEVLRLPAVAETQVERDDAARFLGLPAGEPDPLGRPPGAPLCPSRFGAETLAATRAAVGSRVWSAQYQGVPRPPEGGRFKRAWFQVVERPARVGRWVRFWDNAATDDAGCYTAGVLMGRGVDGYTYVADVIRGQWSTHARNERLRRAAEGDRAERGLVHIRVEQEPGSAGVDVIRGLVQALPGLPLAGDRPTGSKDTRLEPFAAACEAGQVRLVAGPWVEGFVEELASVPTGRYRDQADAAAGAYNFLGRAGTRGRTGAAAVDGRDPWGRGPVGADREPPVRVEGGLDGRD